MRWGAVIAWLGFGAVGLGAAREATAVASPVPRSAAAGHPSKTKLELELEAATASHGEDGRGRTVVATDPLALQIRGPLPVRALDPVLHVGALHFHNYGYPAKGVLQFVVADRALLPAGAEVYIQWGTDAASRVVLTRSLEVPP